MYQALQNYEFEMEEFTSDSKMPIDWQSFSAFEEAVFWDCIEFLEATIRDNTLLDQTLRKFCHAIRVQKEPGTLSYYVEMNVKEIAKQQKDLNKKAKKPSEVKLNATTKGQKIIDNKLIITPPKYSANQQNVGVYTSGGSCNRFDVHSGPRCGLYYISNQKKQPISSKERLENVKFSAKGE